MDVATGAFVFGGLGYEEVTGGGPDRVVGVVECVACSFCLLLPNYQKQGHHFLGQQRRRHISFCKIIGTRVS